MASRETDVIEISSSSESEPDASSSSSAERFRSPKKKFTTLQRRNVVQSSDEEGCEVIDISDSDGEDSAPPVQARRSDSSSNRRPLNLRPSLSQLSSNLPSQQASGSTSKPKVDFVKVVDDGALLVWDAPRSPRKPLRTEAKPKSKVKSLLSGLPPTPTTDPGSSLPVPKPNTPKSRSPRANSKKAIETARFARLESYAQTLFDELNSSVFSGGLKGAQLLWSKTLQVTAGRASFRRHQDGRIETKIELAIKVLDCEERVRHTLAHEMCHLASWVISGRPTENHGSVFKGWGQRVESRRKDIRISTTHNYEIAYKFNWKCDRCEMQYGRHSKSIKPEDRCGRCKEGRLMPQWDQRARKPRLASTEPLLGSPMRAPKKAPRPAPTISDVVAQRNAHDDSDSLFDSDDDVEALATVLKDTRLDSTV